MRSFFTTLLTPSSVQQGAHRVLETRILLVISAVILALSPLAMPEGYSPTAHTTSQSAAQGVTGAWVSRLAFLIFGISVFLTASRKRTV